MPDCDTGPSLWSMLLRPHVSVSSTPPIVSDGVDTCILHGKMPWGRLPHALVLSFACQQSTDWQLYQPEPVGCINYHPLLYRKGRERE